MLRTPDMAPRGRAVAAGTAALAVGLGLGRFGWGPVGTILTSAGFTPRHIALAGTLNFAGYLAGALIGFLGAGRFGVRGLIVAAAAVPGAFLLVAMERSVPAYQAAAAVTGLCGGLLMVFAPVAALADAGSASRALHSGVVFAGVGSGTALSGLLVPAVAAGGPAAAASAMAVAGALLTLVVAAGRLDAPVSVPIGAAALRLNRAARIRLLGLGSAYCGVAVGFVPHTVQWVDVMARELGLGLMASGLAWALLGAGAALGPLALGAVAARLGFRRTLDLAFMLIAAAVAAPFVWPGGSTALSSLAVGTLTIGSVALASGRCREIVGAGAHARAWALLTCAYAVAQVLGAAALATLLAAGIGRLATFALAGAAVLAGAALNVLCERAARHTEHRHAS